MAWEENSRICLHMQLIAILSRTGVGIFPITEQFDALLAQTIDSTLGMRCKWYGYQYSEILRSLMCVYLCGGSCVEDVTTHLVRHLSLHPSLRTCSADTILRAIEELTCENTTYQSASGRVYDFNTADKMNSCWSMPYLQLVS